jgi:Fe-Mn family superoxide dismutase
MPKMDRRHFLQTAGAGAAALALAPLARAANAGEEKYPFKLPPLPYKYDALEPSIDKRTMQIHHDKHHKAYVDNLNAAVKGHADVEKMTLTDILKNLSKLPDKIRTAVRNNGGGHMNHSMFWEFMGPEGKGKPMRRLATAIDNAFGNFADFQKKFKQAAMTRFGSGWAWLVVNKGKLEIMSTANQDTPISTGKTPILGVDVWEHAYYLKYQNLRGDYVDKWWNVVNWDDVLKRYMAVPSS